MQIKIEKMDHSGRGIGYINGKITFIPKSVEEDILDITITKEKKNYQEGIINKIIVPSKKRVDAKCPYFLKCGGCDLQNLSYEDTLLYKKNKIINIFQKLNLDIEPTIIANESPYNYRNKIELQIINGKIGYFESNTNSIVEISKCLIVKKCINDTIKNIKKIKITNGRITIRCNSIDELLIIINTKEKLNINIEQLKENIKLVGIILNNKTLYGDNFLIEQIDNYYFKVAYDAFFQVNPYITKELFRLINDYLDSKERVLDLYCGVGTLSIIASKKSQEVLGIEIIPNAVINAVENAKMNKCNNVKFILNDVAKAIDKIGNNFDTIIVDPPRKGLDKYTIDVIDRIKPKKIIYVSCDPHTLQRDLSTLLNNYKLTKITLLDMFSYTYHVETVSVLCRKTIEK